MKRAPCVRVAIIKFSPQGKDYVASCERNDICVGDEVEILTGDDCYENALVVGIQHERWKCTKFKVVNLASEVGYGFDSDFVVTRTVEPPHPALRLVGRT